MDQPYPITSDDKGMQRQSRNGTGLFAKQDIITGQLLCRIVGSVTARPTMHSIQAAENVHIEPGDASWRFINHSCEANLRISFDRWEFVADRDILAGQELTFNYLTTEALINYPFRCSCGSRRCFGYIGGYSRLSRAEQGRFDRPIAPHLRLLQPRSTDVLPSVPQRVRRDIPMRSG